MKNSVEMTRILVYSDRKNSTKIIPEYSVINPATSSDSASGRSNGDRFTSAIAEIINKILIGNYAKKTGIER